MNDTNDELYKEADAAWERVLRENPMLLEHCPQVKALKRELRGLVLDAYWAGLQEATRLITPSTAKEKIPNLMEDDFKNLYHVAAILENLNDRF